MHRCFRKTPFWGNCRGVSAEGPEAGSLANREAVSENRAEWDPGHIVQGPCSLQRSRGWESLALDFAWVLP